MGELKLKLYKYRNFYNGETQQAVSILHPVLMDIIDKWSVLRLMMTLR